MYVPARPADDPYLLATVALEVSPAAPGEISTAIAVLRSAGLGSNVGRLLDFPLVSACGELIVARDARRVVGGAAVVCFGVTGWIGALGVARDARRRGVGAALTRACVDWLGERGSATTLLYATPAGRPVYLREGFEIEDEARAWRDVAPPHGYAPAPAIRVARPDDLAAIRALDRAATGEQRAAVLDALPYPLDGIVAVDGDDRPLGSALRSPWGLGPSVVADSPASGLALLSALRRGGGRGLTISLPSANREATAALSGWGLDCVNSATRMRLGPPPPYDPARVFGLFNLFWG